MHVLEINALQVIMRNVAGLELVNQLSPLHDTDAACNLARTKEIMGRHQYRDTLITKGRDELGKFVGSLRVQT